MEIEKKKHFIGQADTHGRTQTYIFVKIVMRSEKKDVVSDLVM